MPKTNYVKRFILLSCFLLLLGPKVLGQLHPLSRVDSATVINNLNEYQNYLGKKDYRSATDAINKVAFTYWNNNHYQEAIKYYKISLSLNERLFNENGIAMINNNLGMLYSDVEEYELSLGHFRKTLAARKSNKEKDGVISALVNMSVVLNNLKRYQESVDKLQEALSIAKEIQDLDQMRSVYGMLSETYEKLGDLDESRKYFEQYRTFNEEVKRREIAKVNQELTKEKVQRQQLELQKSKQENELLKQRLELYEQEEVIVGLDSTNRNLLDSLTRADLEISYVKEKQKNAELEAESKARQNEILQREKDYLSTVTWIIVITSVIIIGGVAFIVVRTRRHNKILEEKNAKIEEQNEQVTALNEDLKDINEEQKRIIIELEETKEKLNMSEKMASIGSVVAGIAHEINNSVNFIVGSAELICKIVTSQEEETKKMMGEDYDVINELQETIMAGTKRTNMFISKLRNDNYKITRFLESSLPDIFDRAFKTVKQKMEEKHVDLNTEIPEQLSLDCIPEHVEQLLINVLDNAIEAVNDEGKINVTVTNDSQKAEITIEDNGVGIDTTDIQKIYDPFYTTKDVGKGSGLGLYMAYSYVASHNGSIDVDETYQDGTRFVIKLPLVQESKSVEVQEQSF